MVGQLNRLLVRSGTWPHAVIAAAVLVLLALSLYPGHQSAPAAAKPSISPKRAALPPPPDCSVVACMALTFDDGPSSAYTPQILDILDRHGVKATFFVLGSNVAGNEALLQRTYASGHEIGNHTWGHPRLTALTPDQ